MNKFALITGGSNGIGKALAYEFAEDGYNLVLIDHSQDRIDSLHHELANAFPSAEIISIVKDLTEANAPEEIYQELEEKDIIVHALVNDADVRHEEGFFSIPLDMHIYLIRRNVEALTKLTSLFLPEMINRNKGYIINLGSVVGFQPGPLMAIYHATKAYVVSLSESIAEEIKDTNITVTCICPDPTGSDFLNRIDIGDTRIIEETDFVSTKELAHTGYKIMKNKERVYIPKLTNKVLTSIRKVMPIKLQTQTQQIFYDRFDREEYAIA